MMKKKPSTHALRIPCPEFFCGAPAGKHCTKLSQYGAGRIRMSIAHLKRRREEVRTR